MCVCVRVCVQGLALQGGGERTSGLAKAAPRAGTEAARGEVPCMHASARPRKLRGAAEKRDHLLLDGLRQLRGREADRRDVVGGARQRLARRGHERERRLEAVVHVHHGQLGVGGLGGGGGGVGGGCRVEGHRVCGGVAGVAALAGPLAFVGAQSHPHMGWKQTNTHTHTHTHTHAHAHTHTHSPGSTCTCRAAARRGISPRRSRSCRRPARRGWR